MTKTAVLYARISVASEESVSVARQLDAGRKYAAARGWRIVGEFVDDGVSATRNKPEGRAAWAALLGSTDWFDAVIIWKVDRLARRVIDFLHVDQVLLARGAAIVCVEQNFDMTTGEGRAFAQILAVFGELEASAISSRLAAARAYMLGVGRFPGGVTPYGYRAVPNPAGAGRVVEQDPERVEWLRAMARRTLAGANVNATRRWLDQEGAPLPRGIQRRRPGHGWGYTAVENILRNPILAGLTLHNPGQDRGGPAREVLREPDGSPRVRRDLAVITLAEREAMLHLLDNKTHHAAIPRSRRVTTPRTLSGLAWCGPCDRMLHRATAVGRPVLKCPRCAQQIAMSILMPHLTRRLLEDRGALPMYALAYRPGGEPAALAKLTRTDQAVRDTATALTLDDANVPALTAELARLKIARTKARRTAGVTRQDALVPAGCTVAEVWAHCATDDQQRAVLAGQLESLVIHRATSGGRYLEVGRVELVWRTESRGVVPDGVRLGDQLTSSRVQAPPDWISTAEAVNLTGCTDTTIRNAARCGLIVQRKTHRVHPSLDRTSVLTFAETHRRSVDGREDRR